MTERKPLTIDQVEAIVGHIRFRDRRFRVLRKGDGFLLQMTYTEHCIDTGQPALQSTRKHYISPWSTETEIVETAFYCVRRSQEHVAREHFTYRGRRVQSPHFDVQARVRLCDERAFDARDKP